MFLLKNRSNNENNNNNCQFQNIKTNEKKIKKKENNKKNNIKKISVKELDLINNFKVEYKINPIEEYDELIMKNLFIEEINNRPDYIQLFDLIKQNKNTIKRYPYINLALSICETFDLREETFYLSINLFDRYIQDLNISKKLYIINTKLIMLTCVFISSKYEEIYPPLIEDYLKLFNTFSQNELLDLENDILSKLNFDLHTCSPYLFLTKFFTYIENKENSIILHGAQFILDLCLISPDFCIFKPSFQAVICLYMSKRIFSNNKDNNNFLWTSQNEFNTGYSENKIKQNLKIPVQIIKDFFSGKIFKDYSKTALFKKYTNLKYSNVAYYFKEIKKI